ncbi:MAG: selenide, water dikinase SelD [bacterium]|nr:selenide, water dikinase SelD [bacterium]
MPTRLTSFSKGGGCGCKIAPDVLSAILSQSPITNFPALLVGNNSNDDAAVYEINEEQCIISTTDFFLPIVDSPFDFGQIAAANAISDVYAMGGNPIMAIAILGWPIDHLPIAEAQEVMRGAQAICAKAGIPIAGGHSIQTSEPLFGLSVNGIVKKEHLKRNNTCQAGDTIYLSKPLGLGLMANAIKHDKLSEAGYARLIALCITLNTLGHELGAMECVTALTDVTGFGLLGHLNEMLGPAMGAELSLEKIPVEAEAKAIAEQFIYPNITTNNYNYIKDRCTGLNGLEFLWLCDPQTSGGLLFTSNEKIIVEGCYEIGNVTANGIIAIN